MFALSVRIRIWSTVRHWMNTLRTQSGAARMGCEAVGWSLLGLIDSLRHPT